MVAAAALFILIGLLLISFHGPGWKIAGAVLGVYGLLLGLLAAAEHALLHFPS